MTNTVATRGVHHVTLTVTDVQRSREFYTTILNFQPIGEFGPRILLTNGSMVLAIGPAPDPAHVLSDDRFDENRVGLDHISLSVSSRADLDEAVRIFDERGVPHGEIKDLGAGSELYVLAFRDPDNIQLELSATYS